MRLRMCAAIWILLLSVTSVTGAAPNWAERLGFPPGQRVVIFYCDDAGLAYEFNRPCQEALVKNTLQSVGVVAVGNWFPEFASWRRQHPQYDVGLSIALINPSEAIQFGPASSCDQVSTLVDSDGNLVSSLLQFSLRADAQDVRRELERQIQVARAAGLAPTHLVPHMGCLLTRLDLLEIYLDVAERYWIPAIMVEFTPEQVAKFRQEGFPLDDSVVDLVATYPLPKVDDVIRVPAADSYEQKREQFLAAIRGLSPGITQIFLSPALKTPALSRMTPQWKNLVWDAKLLEDKQVKKCLEDEQILMTNWVEIMKRFEARP